MHFSGGGEGVEQCEEKDLPARQWAGALWGAKWEVLLGVMYGFGSSVYNKGGAPEQISALQCYCLC